MNGELSSEWIELLRGLYSISPSEKIAPIFNMYSTQFRLKYGFDEGLNEKGEWS